MLRITELQWLNIGPLPSRQQLDTLAEAGYRQLLNVSGVALGEVYSDAMLSRFGMATFRFADVFSQHGHQNESLSKPTSTELYLRHSDDRTRQQFASAVRALADLLQRGERTYIFCHLGRSRSPIVAAAAVQRCRPDQSLTIILQQVREIRPQAYFTDLSLSALSWCKQHLH